MKKGCASCEKEVEVSIMIDNKYYCEDCVVTCFHCGSIIPKEKAEEIDGYWYCDNCFVLCDNCGTHVALDKVREVDGGYFCEDCFNSYFHTCYGCDMPVSDLDVIYVEGEPYCPDCVDAYTVTCDRCDATVHVDSAHSDDYITICDSCFNNYYYICNNCHRIISSQETMFDSNGDTYCEDCVPNDVIRSWDYKPAPTFFGNDSKLYMGVELEVDHPKYVCSKREAIKEINDIMGKHVYFKEDGSLDDGFEIVSNPMTLNYHMNKCPWKDMLEAVVDIGFRSHDAYTCGLHVHVSRTGLGETTEEQEETIMKILFFVERFWTPLVTFSRRKEGQLARWAKRYGLKSDVQDVPKDLLDRAKYCNKYYAVNLNPYHTIEFRLFRGTLNYTTFMATLQFVHTVVEFVKATTIEELMDLTWQDFIKKIIGKYEELDEYLARRDLLGEFKPIQESFMEAIEESNNEDDYSDEDCEDEESYDLDFDFSFEPDYSDSIIGGY